MTMIHIIHIVFECHLYYALIMLKPLTTSLKCQRDVKLYYNLKLTEHSDVKIQKYSNNLTLLQPKTHNASQNAPNNGNF